jgi:hypothetical protein
MLGSAEYVGGVVFTSCYDTRCGGNFTAEFVLGQGLQRDDSELATDGCQDFGHLVEHVRLSADHVVGQVLFL